LKSARAPVLSPFPLSSPQPSSCVRNNHSEGRRRDAAILGSQAGRAKPFSPAFFMLVSSPLPPLRPLLFFSRNEALYRASPSVPRGRPLATQGPWMDSPSLPLSPGALGVENRAP
jgi:hypothetical protein